MKIAAGSEREERGMGGLHHGRLWKANVAIGWLNIKYCGGAILVGTAQVL